MANLYRVVVSTNAQKEVRVVANSAEEAQSKVALAEGEAVVQVADEGEVTV